MQLRKYRILLLVALIVVAVLSFASCTAFRVGERLEAEDDRVYETQIGEFDYSQVTLNVTYSDGSRETVTLTEDLVPPEERIKLFHPGEQKIKVVYGNVSCVISVFVNRNEMNGLTLSADPIVYDGKPHTITVDGELPSGAVVNYPLGNTFTNAGEHRVVAAVSCDGYETVILSATVVIERADPDLGDLTFTDATFTYDGKSHMIKAENIPAAVSVGYEIYTGDGLVPLTEAVNAGVYLVKMPIYVHDTVNYNPVAEPMKAVLTILPAEYDMSAVKLSDVTLTYDGEEHTLAPTGKMPAGVSVRSTVVTPKSGAKSQTPAISASDAGEYLVTVSFASDTVNYKPIPDMTATLTIRKAVLDLSAVSLLPYANDFDGKAHSVSVTGKLPADVVVDYRYNGNAATSAVAAGSYHVEALFRLDRPGAENYELVPASLDTLLIIRSVNYNTPFSADNISYRSGTAPGEDHFRVTHMEEGINVAITFTKDGEPVASDALVRGERYGFTAVLSFADPVWNASAVIPPVSGETYLRELIEVETITFPSRSFVYDGTEHIGTLSCELPADAVSYYNNKRTTAGKNEMMARIDTDQYIVVDAAGKSYTEFSAFLTVERAMIDVSGVTLSDLAVPYDGTPHSLVLSGTLPDGVSVIWSEQNLVRSGSYRITATFDYDKENYQTSQRYLSAVLTITRKEISTADFSFSDQELEYDGNKHSLSLTVPADPGFTYEIVYGENEFTDAGDWVVHATLVYDTDLYEVVEGKIEFEAHLRIKPKKLNLTQFEKDNNLVNGAGSQQYDFEKSDTSNPKGKPHSFVLNVSHLPAGVPYVNGLQGSVYGIGQWKATLTVGGGNYEEKTYEITLVVLTSLDAFKQTTYSDFVSLEFISEIPLVNVASLQFEVKEITELGSEIKTYPISHIDKGQNYVVFAYVEYTNSTGPNYIAVMVLILS